MVGMKQILFLLCLLGLAGQAGAQFALPAGIRGNEVYYQVLVRSFYDSNGDGVGDLKGLQSKLDYLQGLGVTALWINPIVPSVAYHNYFADDFMSVDPAYGTMEDFRDLMKDIHKRGMKLLLDMETQYVGGGHPWYTESTGKPKSRFASFLQWKDPDLTVPQGGYMGATTGTGWNKKFYYTYAVNLNDPKVMQAQKEIYTFWLDPNNDGDLSDGVDGYRIDHCMDDLDNNRRATNLLAGFWKPIVDTARKVRKNVVFLAEQSDWASYGQDILLNADMDAVFNIPLRFGLTTLSKPEIVPVLTRTANLMRDGKVGFTHLENHDITRMATMVGGDVKRLKASAVLMMTTTGIPVLYYGQELGMKGEKIKGGSDGNDIPMREAFPWYAAMEGPGMALWYKGDFPWWNVTNLKPHSGLSLEEQGKDPESLYAFWKKLIAIRKASPMFATTKCVEVTNDQKFVLSYVHELERKAIITVVNLSNKAETVVLDWGEEIKGIKNLMTGKPEKVKEGFLGKWVITIGPWESKILAN